MSFEMVLRNLFISLGQNLQKKKGFLLFLVQVFLRFKSLFRSNLYRINLSFKK